MPMGGNASHTYKIEQALALGYCIISRHHREASRLDRADWLEYMNTLNSGNFRRNASGASQYRRCHSHDRIKIPQQWLKLLPNSDDPKAPTTFKEASP